MNQRWYSGLPVPCRGIDDGWKANALAGRTAQPGHKQIILRPDGEPAIVALRAAAALLRSEHGVEVVVEESGVGDSSSDGSAELVAH